MHCSTAISTNTFTFTYHRCTRCPRHSSSTSSATVSTRPFKTNITLNTVGSRYATSTIGSSRSNNAVRTLASFHPHPTNAPGLTQNARHTRRARVTVRTRNAHMPLCACDARPTGHPDRASEPHVSTRTWGTGQPNLVIWKSKLYWTVEGGRRREETRKNEGERDKRE